MNKNDEQGEGFSHEVGVDEIHEELTADDSSDKAEETSMDVEDSYHGGGDVSDEFHLLNDIESVIFRLKILKRQDISQKLNKKK